MKSITPKLFQVLVLAIGILPPSIHFPFYRANQKQALAPSATKFDEYGELIQEDEAARLDRLKKYPEANGYIIAYVGPFDPPGGALRIALRAKEYLAHTWGSSTEHVFTQVGGRRDAPTVELWVAPDGAKPPLSNPTVEEAKKLKNSPWKYDEYLFGYEFSWNSFELPNIRLHGFAEELRSRPAAKAYIVGYALNGDDRLGVSRDPSGTALQNAKNERLYLINVEKLIRVGSWQLTVDLVIAGL